VLDAVRERTDAEALARDTTPIEPVTGSDGADEQLLADRHGGRPSPPSNGRSVAGDPEVMV
jgi:hypothetical protein